MATANKPSPSQRTTDTSNWCARARECMNELRIVPRCALVSYFVYLGYTGVWFMNLPDPSGIQMTYATLIAGLLPAMVGLYQGSITAGANSKAH